MCCQRIIAVEGQVRESADEKGWITAWKVVRVRDNGDLTPMMAVNRPAYKKGRNRLPPNDRNKEYNTYLPRGFHVYLDYQDAKAELENAFKWDNAVWDKRIYRIIEVKGHVKSLMRAGTSFPSRGKIIRTRDEFFGGEAVFRNITIPSLKECRLVPKMS